MSNGQISDKEIGLIGALGGFCLSLLKLIESGFFIDNFLSTNSIAAYFTYIAYIFFGVIIALYFTERSLEPAKLKKNAFILGLLAPSLLLALSTRPIGEGESITHTLKGLPNLGSIVSRSAYAAACPKGYITALRGACIKGDEVKKKDVEPSFLKSILNAIGRPQPKRNFTFAVGVAKDGSKAEAIANDINKNIIKGMAIEEMSARVIKPEGNDAFIVTVGEFGSITDTQKVEKAMKSLAVEELTKTTDPNTKSSAEAILKGGVIDGISLFSGGF